MEQATEQIFFADEAEWKAARLGLFTASEMHRLMGAGKRLMTAEELAKRPKEGAGSKSKTIEDENILSDGAITYIKEKVVEVLAEPKPDFYSAEMQWGKDNEGPAVKEWADRMGLSVLDPEFLYCGVNDPIFFNFSNIAGGTPDVIITDAIAEVKCPNSTTHLSYLLMDLETFKSEKVDYYTQIQTLLLFTKKTKAYFVSYDPRYKEKRLQMKVIEIPQDLDYQKLILLKISLARVEFDRIMQVLNAIQLPCHEPNQAS